MSGPGPRRQLLWGGAAVAVVLALFFGLFERYEQTITLPPDSKTRTNPYLAAERLVEQLGVKVVAQAELADLPRPATGAAVLWFAALSPHFKPPVALRGWVEEGGHLVWAWAPESDEERDLIPGYVQAVAPPAAATVLADAPPPVSRGGLGAGAVTWLGDGDRYRNEKVVQEDSAASLWAALRREGPPREVVVIAWPTSPSLWSMLVSAAWPALISLWLLLAVWLWRSSSRLGPIREVAAPTRRSITEHIHASGLLLWRTGQADVALAASRAALQARLHTVLPATVALQGDALHRAVAAALDVPVATVKTAFTGEANDRAAFVAIAKAQQQLEDAT